MNEFLLSATTERADPAYENIDTLPTLELARLMNEGDQGVPLAVAAQLEKIASAVDEIVARRLRGGRLIYVGAGTAGRLGVLDASECPPTFSTDPSEVVGVIAGGQVALTTAVEEVEDHAEQGTADVRALGIGPDDTIVGIAASGRTPYTIGAVEAGRAVGAYTVGLSCNEDTPLSSASDCGIEVVVGPEFVSGSTRLKSGTAQKLVLNMLSTLTMVRTGKTYGTYMVDVSSTNNKLRDRARRIVGEVTGAPVEQVVTALEAAGGAVKTAILMIAADLDAQTATARLSANAGNLRAALGPADPSTTPAVGN